MTQRLESSKKTNDDVKSLGVLYTGYLDKRNPVTGSYKKRFVVLTQDSIHWFKRTEGYDLFGEERGQVTLSNILTTRVLDEDSTAFEIQGTDTKKRLFRASTPAFCEEWVSAIRSAMKTTNNALGKRGPMQRRATLAGIRNIFDDSNHDNEKDFENAEVTVLLVSLSSAKNQTEIVVARKPEWNRLITIPRIKPGDEIIISTSNGGTITLNYDLILQKSDNDREFQEFEQAIQNVPLASSLRISLLREQGSAADIASDAKKEGRKLSKLESLLQLLINITGERRTAVNLVLSLMVIMVGFASLHTVGADTTLLFLLAALLSVYNLNQIVQRVKDGGANTNKGQTIRMILHGHAFTSPDEPVNEPENEIPKRFIDGCEGDLKEARRRWDITRHWREVEGVNKVLEEPQPYFNLIKTMYPHYHAGRGKEGNVVYYERPGEFEIAQLLARGVKVEDMVRHWLFVTEYQWEILCKGDQTAKGISVMDVNGIKLGDLAGDNMAFLKKTISYANQHYPERSFAIMVVNAPFFFSMLWKIVKPMVHENTQKKVKILTAKETLAGLQEFIDIDNIPVYYGGNLDFGGGKDSCRFNSPETVALNEYVRALNEKGSGAQNKTPFDNTTAPEGDAAVNAPPGRAGDIPDARTRLDSTDSGKDEPMNNLPTPMGAAATAGRQLTPTGGKMTPRRASLGAIGPAGAGRGDDWSVASGSTVGAQHHQQHQQPQQQQQQHTPTAISRGSGAPGGGLLRANSKASVR